MAHWGLSPPPKKDVKHGVSVLFMKSDQNVGRNRRETASTDGTLNAMNITLKLARLLRLWVRIPPGAWIFVCCDYRVLSGRGLCDELITRPEESYRLWCVVVCDLETS